MSSSPSSSFTHIYSNSSELRDMFMKINPFHFSCPYKEAFGEHALDTLRKCDDEFDMFFQLGSNKTDCAPVSYDEDTMEEDVNKEPHEQNDCGSFVTDFFKIVISDDVFQQEDPDGYCTWVTCNCRHPKYASLKFLASSIAQSASIAQAASISRVINTRTVNGARKPEGMNADQSRVIHIVRSSSNNNHAGAATKASSGSTSTTSSRSSSRANSATKYKSTTQEPRTESRQARSASDATIESWSWRYKSPVKNRSQNQARQKKVDPQQITPCIVQQNVPQDSTSISHHRRPITYKFKHNMPASYYINIYRDMYTIPHTDSYTESLTTTRRVPSGENRNKKMPRARIHCTDVRKGAKMSTNDGLAKLYFNVYQTVNPNGNKNSPTPFSVKTRELKMVESLKVQVTGMNKGPSATPATPMAYIPTTTPCVPQPIVNRSRPSIPSNAHGIVCDSAIETPSYKVAIRGKSLSEDKPRPGSSGSRPSPQLYLHHHGSSQHQAWSR